MLEHVSGLAQVTSGWSGTLTTTVGAVTATLSPPLRTSAAEVARELARLSQRTHGGTWQAWVTSAGKLVVEASLAFGLNATGFCATQTGYSAGPYASATSVEATDAHPGGVYPAGGVGADIGGTSLPLGVALGDGSSVALGVLSYASGGLVLEDDHASLMALLPALATGTTWDVWDGGRIEGRVRLSGPPAVSPRGARLDLVDLRVDVQVVTS